jgi:FkbM family methyltransferase
LGDNSVKVHLFEPQAHLCKTVDAAIKAGHLKNVTLHRIALLDQNGEMTIRRPPHHSGSATLVDTLEGDQWLRETVTVRDVRTYVPPLVIDLPFGVKIDVEGVEMRILPALMDMPNLVYTIFEGRRNQADLFGLQEKGFVLYGLCRTPIVGMLQRVESVDDMAEYHDFLFVRIKANMELPRRARPRSLARLVRNPAFSVIPR